MAETARQQREQRVLNEGTRGPALDELAHTLPPRPVRAIDDQVAAEQNLFHTASNQATLIETEFYPAVMIDGADSPLLVRIEENKIGI